MSESPFLQVPQRDAQGAEIAFTLGFAAHAHRNQEYGPGVPYTEHLTRVLEQVQDLGGSHECQLAALLHDIIEDTEITAPDLWAFGFPYRTIELVLAVTKNPNFPSKPHGIWIEEIIEEGDHEAILLKLADTIVNHESSKLLPETDDRKKRLMAKYGPARVMLREALEASRKEIEK